MASVYFFVQNFAIRGLLLVLVLTFFISGCAPNPLGKRKKSTTTEAAVRSEWQHLLKIQSFNNDQKLSASEHKIAMNASGEAVLTWAGYGSLSTEIFVATRTSGGTWTLPTDVTDNLSLGGTAVRDNSAVAINDSGEIIVVWLQSDASNVRRVYIAERDVNGTWTKPSSHSDFISIASATSANTPRVAMNNSGQVLVGWTQNTGADSHLFVAQRDSSGVWTLPTLLDQISVTGSSVDLFSLDMNASGEAVVAWYQTDGADHQIFKAERASNGVWSVPANLADNVSPDLQPAYEPDVAVNDSFEAIISWTQNDSGVNQIFKAERAANGVWALPANLADNISFNGTNAGRPSIAMNSASQAVITWYQDDGAVYQIFIAERAANGVWTVPANLADNFSPNLQSTNAPDIKMNTFGEVIITWSESNGTNSQIFKAERAANGVWTVPANLADNLSPDGYDTTSPTIVFNDSGAAIIAWESTVLVNNIYISERATNGSWTSPLITEGKAVSGQLGVFPDVAINNSGEAIAAWAQIDSTTVRVFKAERNATGTWTQPTSLADYISGATTLNTSPKVAINDLGEAIIVWSGFDGLTTNIYKAERAIDGSWTYPANAADSVSLNHASVQEAAKVVFNSSGHALIVWLQTDGVNVQVYKAERSGIGVWTLPANAADNVSLFATDTSGFDLAINSSREAIITWSQYDGTFEQIFKAERDSSGVWTLPGNINDNISQDNERTTAPSLALNDSGQAIIAWQQTDGLDSQIFKAERAANGAWTVPANLADNISPNLFDAVVANVKMNSNGEAIITWAQENGTLLNLYLAERDANGIWTIPATIADVTSNGNFSVGTGGYLAINDSGKAVISWVQSNGQENQIYYIERSAEGEWSSLNEVFSNSLSTFPHFLESAPLGLAMNSTGKIIIMYAPFNYGASVSESP